MTDTAGTTGTTGTTVGSNGSGGRAVLLRFWGVRGSIPSPGRLTARYGGNTSCVSVESVEGVEGSDGGANGRELFVFDAGSGLRVLGLHLLQAKRLPVAVHLLLTHTHWDHIQGFPFFTPAFIPGNEITVYGAAGTDTVLAEALEGQMLHRYFPVSLDKLGAAIRFQHIPPGSHRIASARVTVASLHHPGDAAGYRLELNGAKVAYVTDTEPRGVFPDLQLDPNVVALARGADVLIHDAQYTMAEYAPKAGWGHTPMEHVVDTALAAGVKRLFLFHHDPTRTDDQMDVLVDAARERAAQAGSDLIVDAAIEETEVLLGGAPAANAVGEPGLAAVAV